MVGIAHPTTGGHMSHRVGARLPRPYMTFYAGPRPHRVRRIPVSVARGRPRPRGHPYKRPLHPCHGSSRSRPNLGVGVGDDPDLQLPTISPTHLPSTSDPSPKRRSALLAAPTLRNSTLSDGGHSPPCPARLSSSQKVSGLGLPLPAHRPRGRTPPAFSNTRQPRR